MRYIIKLIGYNVFSLFIFFLFAMLFKVPFRWWISIAMTTSSYIVYNYLEKERKGMILYQIIPFLQSTKRKTKSLCTIELTWTKPLIQLKQKHKVRSLKMYFIFVLYIILEWYFIVHHIIKSKKLICTFFQ